MRMPIREMYEDHSLFSLLNAIQGFSFVQQERKKDSWEQTRMICYYALGNSKLMSPKNLFEFPWEKEDMPEMSSEQLKSLFKKKKK